MSDSSTSVPQPSDSRDDPGLTRLIYGAMPLGGSWDADDPLTQEQEQVGFAALDAAEEAGYRDLDLADIYAAGKSETVVGRWLAQDPQRRQRMRVQTKAGIRIPGATAASDAPMHYRLDAAAVRVIFFTASRGHHADIGGILPGSMPPTSTTIFEEGAHIRSFKIVREGVFDSEGLYKHMVDEPAKYPGSSGCRNIRDVESDLKAVSRASLV